MKLSDYVSIMSQTIRTSLPPAGVRLLTSLADEGKTVFSTADAARLLGGSAGRTHTLLTRLVAGGWLERVERGRYFVVPLEAGREARWVEEPFVLATRLASPSAISHWSAAAHWNLTEQIVRTVFVSTTQRKFRSERVVSGVPFRFVHRPERKFFGIVRERLGQTFVPVTSIEKTLVDMLEQPQFSGGIVEAAKALKTAYDNGRVDADALAHSLERLGNGAVVKRAGFLLEFFEFDPDLRTRLTRGLTAGEALLDPLSRLGGPRSARWRLRLNVALSDLTEWEHH